MQIPIEQIWEYEFKPTDTMRLLHAFKNHWELAGDTIELQNRGGRLFAVRHSKESEIEKHYRLLHDYYKEKYGA